MALFVQNTQKQNILRVTDIGKIHSVQSTPFKGSSSSSTQRHCKRPLELSAEASAH